MCRLVRRTSTQIVQDEPAPVARAGAATEGHWRKGRPVEGMVPTADERTPDFVPVLSRGKHFSARRGACFMEFASYLAGERWSDHPSCTHPLLARLARLVNDYIGDAERQRLVGLIPSVVGLTSDDVRVDLRIALRAAWCALPVVAEERQRSMAMTIVVVNGLLTELEGEPPREVAERSRQALEDVPQAARWAHEMAAVMPVSLRRFRRHGAPAAVLYAVDGIAKSCVPDPDARLHDLLAQAIADVEAMVRPAAPPRPAHPVEGLAAAGR